MLQVGATGVDGWMDGWDEWMGWMDGWDGMGWIDGWDGWMDGING
jgi:hypothetical protein